MVTNGQGMHAAVQRDAVMGWGHVSYIAQNSIQIGYGADAKVQNNTVSGNSYTAPNFASSDGSIVAGGPFCGSAGTTDTQIVGNTVVSNDVGICLPIDSAAPHSANVKSHADKEISHRARARLPGDSFAGQSRAGMAKRHANRRHRRRRFG